VANVVWIPGVLGSRIGLRVGRTPIILPVWIDLRTLLAGGVVGLQLAPDGVSPGPLAGGLQQVVQGIVEAAYGPFAVYMRSAGHNVLALGWDWRLHPAAAAPAAAAAIAAWAQGQPVWLVAHSYGGLLARCVAPLAAHSSPSWSVAGTITIGTPHYGSFEGSRLLFGLPPLYKALERWTAPGFLNSRGVGAQWLWQTVNTMPAWYVLSPFRDSGPLASLQPDVAAALYQPGTYRADSQPAAAWLAAAPGLQGSLPGWPAGVPAWSIAGTGFDTPFGWHHLLGGGYDPRNYLHTQQGDGYVTVAQTSLPGAALLTVPVQHTYQPLHPLVWAAVLGILGSV